MSGEDLFLGSPEEERWPLSLDDFEPQLRLRFPDAYIARRQSRVTGQHRLSFTVTLADGMSRGGIYVDHESLALGDGDAATWAETISWFLRLLPPGTGTIAMRGDGPTLADLPDGVRSPADIIAFFADLPD